MIVLIIGIAIFLIFILSGFVILLPDQLFVIIDKVSIKFLLIILSIGIAGLISIAIYMYYWHPRATKLIASGFNACLFIFISSSSIQIIGIPQLSAALENYSIGSLDIELSQVQSSPDIWTALTILISPFFMSIFAYWYIAAVKWEQMNDKKLQPL